MASAMDQLSKGTLKITELVRNISKASEETSTAAEGVAVQAQEMSLRGEELLSRIARFKLQAQKGGGLVPAPDKGRR
jgi:methyl-accepting chemotaxis protein